MTGKLVVLSTFESSVEAHLFKNELENNGIRASVSNENSTAIFGATIGGDSENGLISEWTCNCGETVDEGFAVCWSCGADHG